MTRHGTIEAKLLEGGEVIEGYKFPRSLYAGTVERTEVVDDGIRIHLERGGHFTVPEDEEIPLGRRYSYVGDDDDDE